jgi:transcription initiation factor TFIIB
MISERWHAVNIINTGPEWRAFDNEQRQKKTRATPTKSNLYTGTSFDVPRDTDPEKKYALTRMKRQHNKSTIMSSYDKNIRISSPELDKITSKLNLTGYPQKRAQQIYLEALDKKLVRGRSINGMAAASVYAMIRSEEDIVRTLKEVAAAANYPKKDLGRDYRCLIRELDLRTELDKPEYHISKISSKLGLDTKVEKVANQLLGELKDNKKRIGKNPISVAATAIYIAANYDSGVTQQQVSTASEITEVTIRNRMKDFGVNGVKSSTIKDFVEQVMKNHD